VNILLNGGKQMTLQNNHEIVGVLRKIEPKHDNLVFTFSFEKNVEIPKSAINNQNLNVLIGNRIGILNCEGKIKIRKIKNCNITMNEEKGSDIHGKQGKR
jgi:hypothetical protein